MGGVIETEQERIQSRMRLFDALTPKERAVVHRYGLAPAMQAIGISRRGGLAPEAILRAQGRDPVAGGGTSIQERPSARAKRAKRRLGLSI